VLASAIGSAVMSLPALQQKKLLCYNPAITDKLRHPSIFKLPHVRTTRFKTSFVNYAIDHYL